jgi:hypothetical protein
MKHRILELRHPTRLSRVLRSRNNTENPIMRTLAKLLILVGLGAALTGCVVAPYGPRAYVAPGVVVVHPGYYGPHYYYGPR